MDDRRPKRRRELTPKEKKALENQHKKEQELNRKFDKKAAKYREEARKQARKAEDAHIKSQRPKPRTDDRAVDFSRMSEAERRRKASQNRNVRVQSIEVENEQRIDGARRRSDIMRDAEKKRRTKNAKSEKRREKARPNDTKRRPKKKTLPDIIEKETDKRVRNLEASDHKDGFYADEVAVRKEQAKKQRKERRKRMPKPISPAKRRARRIFAYVSIIVIVITVGIVLSLTVLFKAENIYVSGNKYYPNDTVIRLAKVSEGDNIFIASMFGDKGAVKDSLPYVKSASIGFRLPNSIVINIENATPAYSMKADGLYYMVSDESIILEQVAKKPKNLISMIAPSLKSTKIGDKVEFKDARYTKALDELTACIKKNKYERITEINIRKISDISITYDKRIKIKIGLPESIDYKLRTAFAIINEKLDPNHTGKIKGVLNVSKCDKTKKSYFKEGSITEKEEEITQPSTQATEASTVRTNFIAVPTEETTVEEDYENDNEDDNDDNYNDDEDGGYEDENGDNDENYDEDYDDEESTDPYE